MRRVLIVEDEPHVIRVLRLALEKAGYLVESSPNGEVALEKICQSPPDVLITDIQMPRMGGDEMCLRIQKQMPDRSFPIYVTTSRTEIEHRNWAAKVSHLYFWEKPLSIRKLVADLERWFRQREG